MTLVARRAFTLIEIMAVLIVIGVMSAMVVPRFRVTPATETRLAARQLVRDIEQVRTKALATKRLTRLVFDANAGTYTAYMDHDNDGTIAETVTERNAINLGGIRELDEDVVIGRGSAPIIAGEVSGNAVTLASNSVTFDRRGLPTPFGSRGAVYLTAASDASAVWAVQLSGAGGIRLWRYLNSAWQ
jgi:prepilin-type N-terminal cleavage/methylation domain-containing protein